MAEPEPNATYHTVRMTHLYATAAERFKSAGDFALLGLRSVLLAHGGALIAMLAYLGNAAKPPAASCWLWLTFGAFAAGLICSLLAVLFAYATQSEYARQDVAGSDKIYFNTIGDKPNEEKSDREESQHMSKGATLEWVGISLFLAGLVLFLLGCLSGLQALSFVAQSGS